MTEQSAPRVSTDSALGPVDATRVPRFAGPATGMGREHVPVGVQIMGPRWSDALTLRAAAASERSVPWQRFQPPG